MPEQNAVGGGIQDQESSEAPKKTIERPEYSGKAPEEIIKNPESQGKLHDIVRKNQEEVKKQEKIENVRQTIGQQGSVLDDDDNDDKQTKQEVQDQAKGVSEIDDAEEQIDRIVKIAQEKDPFFAIKVAKQLDDNFVLDKVHDELIEEKVRVILIDKGLLKEV